jgi:hypothetical protein
VLTIWCHIKASYFLRQLDFIGDFELVICIREKFQLLVLSTSEQSFTGSVPSYSQHWLLERLIVCDTVDLISFKVQDSENGSVGNDEFARWQLTKVFNSMSQFYGCKGFRGVSQIP